MRKCLSLLAVLVLFAVSVTAQSRLLTGQVKDEKGNPIPFATIKVKGTDAGSAADNEGSFKIQASKGDVLIITAVGYDKSEVKVGSAAVLTVSMKPINDLQEVVVTALGIKRKPKELGYATSRVTPEQITAGKSFNLGQALSGKVSGLVVYNTSASVNATPRVVLRGLRSITGDNTALIVLDGVPVPSNTLSYINPNDVEDVTVLKGGQAATLYGSDGVNGAILITTKKGTTRKPEVTVTHSSNVEQVAYLPKTQHEFGSGSAYGASLSEDFHPAENQQYGDQYDGSIRLLGRTLQDGSYQLLPYADISDVRKKIWNTGYTSQSDVSFRSGDENSAFYMSYQNVFSNGIVPRDKYYRNSLRMNASKSYNRFKVSFDATYTWDRADRTTSDFYFFALNTPSWVPLDQYKDWKNNKFADPSGYFNDYYNNPWWQLDNNRSDARNTYFNGNITLNYKINSNIDLTYRLAIANTQSVSTSTSNPYTYSAWAQSTSGAYVSNFNRDYDLLLTNGGINRARTPVPGGISESYSNGNRLNSDLFASYNKEFGNISVRAILGNNVQVRTSKGIGASTASIAYTDLFNLGNSSATGLYGASNSKTEQRKIGNYADLSVGLNKYLYLHGIFRYDLSSVFYAPGRSSDLYSFFYYGGDVSLSVTDLFPNIKSDVLNYLKIRAGWNKNGNDNLSPYSLQTVYGSASGFPYSGLLGVSVGNTVVAGDLKPEIVATTEVGAELALWNNRLTLEGSYFTQRAENQILNVSVSSASGFTNYLLNAADVTNKGFEFDGKLTAFRSRDWSIALNANYSHTTNRVNKLFANNGLNSLQFQGDANKTLNAVVGEMFPYMKTTVWERDPQGRVVIDTTDGWPVRASALAGRGNTNPTDILGVGVTVSYKGFTFQANAEYRGGYVVYHDLGEDMTFTGSSALTTIYNRSQFLWPNSVYYDGAKYIPNTDYAISQYRANYSGFGDLGFSRGYQGTGEVFVSSGAFWKLRDISLTYDLPQTVIKALKGVKAISITAWGRNLKTWLAADNWFTDPEFSNTNGNSTGINTTANTPPTRQFGGTLRVTF